MKEEFEKILDKIDFEERWLLSIFRNESKISLKDIEIAMNGIRSVVMCEIKQSQQDEYDYCCKENALCFYPREGD